VESLIKFGRLNETKVANTLVCFGANEVTIFQGLKFGVTTQLMHKHVFFVNNVHFMAPRTSLAIQTFNSLTLVAKIETLFVGMYNFFTHSPKHAFEASKLVELLECKGNKILKNYLTHWISMLLPSKWVLDEYKALVVKMAVGNESVQIVKTNMNYYVM
jgi:hypothetical protein